MEIKVIYYNVVEGALIKTATCEHNSSGAKQLMIQLRGNPDKKLKRLVATMKYVLVAVSCRGASISRANQINEVLTRTKYFAGKMNRQVVSNSENKEARG